MLASEWSRAPSAEATTRCWTARRASRSPAATRIAGPASTAAVREASASIATPSIRTAPARSIDATGASDAPTRLPPLAAARRSTATLRTRWRGGRRNVSEFPLVVMSAAVENAERPAGALAYHANHTPGHIGPEWPSLSDVR